MADTIEQKALALVDKTRRDSNLPKARDENVRSSAAFPALCRAIEQHEAFRQEVGDAASCLLELHQASGLFLGDGRVQNLRRFILPKTDPLVEALLETFPRANGAEGMADDLRAALAARGLEVRKIGEGE